MKEQFLPNQADLTNQAQNPYSKGGGRFMAENTGEVPPQGGQTSDRQRRETPAREAPLTSQEQQELARRTWENLAKQGKLTEEQAKRRVQRGEPALIGGGSDETKKSQAQQRAIIFDGIEYPTLTEKQRQSMSEENIRAFEASSAALRSYIEAVRRADMAGFLDLQEAFQNINNAVARGEIDPVSTEPYFREIAEKGRELVRERFTERLSEDKQVAEVIGRLSDRWEKLKGLKDAIYNLPPDLRPIDQELLRLIAGDEEASEVFLDKIISKPFAAPEDRYELSWYASINLQGFLSEAYKIAPELHERYVHKKEAALRFHEMNRTIISESGNIDAFLGITRTVTPRHLQTATEEDGVEIVRQLIELAYGRLYAKTNRVTGDNFEPEIMGWVTGQFKQLAKDGVVKSRFTDADGNSRNLEGWEINRAIAFGRNIHASFYRHSELISWSNVPKEFEGWLKSLPTETVVRVLGGLKWLTYRFRVGNVRGGPELVALLYDKIKEKSYKTNLTKIGALDIQKDILPVGFFRAGGFDKGWRTINDYLDSDAMRITIPDPKDFPEEVRDGVKEFLDEHNGVKEANLGSFLMRQEYAAQKLASDKAEIAGVELPEELRKHDPKKQTEMVEKILLRLLGWRSKDPKKTDHKNYKFNKDDFGYDESQDQINLSLGVLISFGASSEFVKTVLWHKVADFLPLRVAYFLSDDGTAAHPITGTRGARRIIEQEKFRQFKGEGNSLFDSAFESKLIKAQLLRIQAQKETPNRKVNLENFYDQAGLTELEKELIGELQKLGRQNAKELAKMSFPHIAFLDDVAFQKANYITLGAEVFPRRMGGDFRAYYEVNNAFNGIASNLGQPWEEGILKGLSAIVDNMSTPEGIPTGQDVALPILQSYLELTKQWSLTKIPLVKTILNFMNKATSHTQRIFGPNAPSDDESELNLKARTAVEKGIIRREKKPEEEKSQLDELLEKVGGNWVNVLWRELRNALVIYFFLMALKFGEKTVNEKA